MTASLVGPHWNHARLRGCSMARERALTAVLGESTPRNVGYEFLEAPADDDDIGPLRMLRFRNPPGLPPDVSLFCTSGLSDPGRGDLPIDNATEDRFSGVGIEVALAVRNADNGSGWAQQLLAEVALLVVERDQPAMVGDFIPVAEDFWSHIAPDDSHDDDNAPHFTHVGVIEGGPHRSRLVLPTGHCVILHAVGLFDSEVDAVTNQAFAGAYQRVRHLIRSGLTRVSSRTRAHLEVTTPT